MLQKLTLAFEAAIECICCCCMLCVILHVQVQPTASHKVTCALTVCKWTIAPYSLQLN